MCRAGSHVLRFPYHRAFYSFINLSAALGVIESIDVYLAGGDAHVDIG